MNEDIYNSTLEKSILEESDVDDLSFDEMKELIKDQEVIQQVDNESFELWKQQISDSPVINFGSVIFPECFIDS